MYSFEWTKKSVDFLSMIIHCISIIEYIINVKKFYTEIVKSRLQNTPEYCRLHNICTYVMMHFLKGNRC